MRSATTQRTVHLSSKLNTAGAVEARNRRHTISFSKAINNYQQMLVPGEVALDARIPRVAGLFADLGCSPQRPFELYVTCTRMLGLSCYAEEAWLAKICMESGIVLACIPDVTPQAYGASLPPGLRPSQVRTLSGTKTAMELPPLQVRLICASAPSLNLFLRYHRLGRRIKCLTVVPPKNISISSALRLHNSALLSKHSQSTSRPYSINSSSPRYSRASIVTMFNKLSISTSRSSQKVRTYYLFIL